MSENRLLIVDDDPAMRSMLVEYLRGHGFAVDEADSGAAMRERLQANSPDLVLLDLGLPGEDGLTLARYLREHHDCGIVMVTGTAGTVDRIVGLEVGADDYLAKPFNPRELLARIRAVLRRGAGQEGEKPAEEGEHYDFGPFRLDLAAQRLLREGEEITITHAEYALLKIFAEHPNRALSRDQIMDWLKGFERDPFDRSIDVRVTRLRKKIEDDPANPVYIRTVWGQGYLFAPKGKLA